jgi:predicted ATPase/DNA-binding winged helix-turn-helix (wHTH) protein
MNQFEQFRLDTANGCLWRNGTQIILPPKPFAVLRYLVENPGRVITHDELLDALWPETFVQPQVLRTYVLELRKALGDDADQPRFIQTLPKRGYRFVAPVSEWAGTVPIAVGKAEPDGVLADFVNRAEELDRLKAEFADVAGGERRVIFVTGEAGIGKTALVDAFSRLQNMIAPAAIARGQCVPGFGAKEEYYPVMEALSQLCASVDGDAACGALSKLAPAWLAHLGRHTEAMQSAASTSRQRMPGDLCAALEEFASTKPLILILEDLHWADDATLNLISALARRRAKAKLMVVATCRLRSAAADHQLMAFKQELLMGRLCKEIALAPLSRLAVMQLLGRELRQDGLPEELGVFVHQHSEGNPLFAIAMIEHLIAQRFLECLDQEGTPRWQLRLPLDESDAGVPGELAQMVEVEIERLNPREQSVLEAGSLMDIAFPAWAVAAALDEDAIELEELCDALARRVHFLERAGQDELPGGNRSGFYVFTHGLYREVLYQRQAAARRAERHVRIAERLGELFKGREANVAQEMAMHFEAAGHWERAAAALRKAADRAGLRQAHAEAAELRERASRIAARAENLTIS